MDPQVFHARHLGHPQSRLRGPHVQRRLHLEAAAIERECRQDTAPEGVVPVAQIGVGGLVEPVDEPAEQPVPGTPQERDVLAPTPVHEPRPLGVVRPVEQRGDEALDLGAVGRAVGVHHHDDVAGASGEPGPQGVALPAARLTDDHDVRIMRPGDRRRSVDRVPVDENELVRVGRQRRENVREVVGLVQRRDDDADFRRPNVPTRSCRRFEPAHPVPLSRQRCSLTAAECNSARLA